MKLSTLSKFMGAGLLAASLSILPLTPATQAQVVDPEVGAVEPEGIIVQREDDSFDWGWLGLLGLIGLAGLAGRNKPKQRVHTVHERDVVASSRPGVGYTSNHPDVVVRNNRPSDYR